MRDKHGMIVANLGHSYRADLRGKLRAGMAHM
jgi:hypothetical protein